MLIRTDKEWIELQPKIVYAHYIIAFALLRIIINPVVWIEDFWITINIYL